ncbi:hypothetical protein [Achromobacter phage Motura]|uniref:Uncharacterized protein n=1 Tax=Achromobacter phage Motura TaxID=2591403 RepID=A0A514CT25_9CAUD|nr:hypothetical protein H1O15_gp174 [Achromobacter phage Motura]QDH83614.1 hypothetical protein [Achromobacter phage Motura]
MTYEVLSATRLEALTANDISPKTVFALFYKKLGTAERKFFRVELPKLLEGWFGGSFMHQGKNRKSERLESSIEARSYHKVDAIAVALAHIKQVFPVKAPAKLYRVTGINKEQQKTPVGDTVTLDLKSTLTPILSFSSKVQPNFRGHSTLDLEWKTDQRLVLSTPRYLLMFAESTAKMLRSLLVNTPADKLTPQLKKEYAAGLKEWTRLYQTMKEYRAESEYIVWVPGNEGLACTVLLNRNLEKKKPKPKAYKSK